MSVTDEAAPTTDAQLELLRSELDGAERCVLELGCGDGRRTHDLARLIAGRAIGVDAADALARAQDDGGVRFRIDAGDGLPVDDSEADAVVTSSYLGCLDADARPAAAAELKRALRPGGLVFLAEPAAVAGELAELLPWASLREVGRDGDATLLAGRLGAAPPVS